MMAAVSSVNPNREVPNPEVKAALTTLAKAALRQVLVREARTWIGTPYHHRAALRGVGCDCLGLLRGIWRDVLGQDVVELPRYTGDWGDVSGDEALLDGLAAHLAEVPRATALPGDVLVFRMFPGRVAKHCAILTAPQAFVHAWQSTPTIEVVLSDWWDARIIAVFRARELAESI
jgi:NlpC/P60 family putative phage cell wall peptidase